VRLENVVEIGNKIELANWIELGNKIELGPFAGVYEQMLKLAQLTDSRAGGRTVLALPSDGLITDDLLVTTIPAGVLPIKGGRWLGDSWSLYDANGTLLTDAAIDNEDGVTNLVTDSIDLSTWSTSSSYPTTITSTAVLAPDGTNTGTELTNTVASAGSRFSKLFDVTENTKYTFSFYSKKGSLTDQKYAIYDLTNAAFIVEGSYFGELSTGWGRVPVAFTTPAGCTQIYCYLLKSENLTGTANFWGVDLKEGGLSSYIPTNGETFSRITDNISFPKPSVLSAASGAIKFRYTPRDTDGGTLIKCGDIDITCTDSAITFGAAEYAQEFVIGTEYIIQAFWIYDFIAVGVNGNFDVATGVISSLADTVYLGSDNGTDVAAGEFPIIGDKAPTFYKSPLKAEWIEIVEATNPDGSPATNPDGSIAYNPPIIL
jgi:hypothetical protein